MQSGSRSGDGAGVKQKAPIFLKEKNSGWFCGGVIMEAVMLQPVVFAAVLGFLFKEESLGLAESGHSKNA